MDRLFLAGSHPKLLVGNLVLSSEMGAAPSHHPVRPEIDPAGIHKLYQQRLELGFFFFFQPLYAVFPCSVSCSCLQYHIAASPGDTLGTVPCKGGSLQELVIPA